MPCSEDALHLPSIWAWSTEKDHREHHGPDHGVLKEQDMTYIVPVTLVPPMEKALVKTEIRMALPSGCYGQVEVQFHILAWRQNISYIWQLVSQIKIIEEPRPGSSAG